MKVVIVTIIHRNERRNCRVKFLSVAARYSIAKQRGKILRAIKTINGIK